MINIEISNIKLRYLGVRNTEINHIKFRNELLSFAFLLRFPTIISVLLFEKCFYLYSFLSRVRNLLLNLDLWHGINNDNG